jgi:solute carrier family 25, member 39/40
METIIPACISSGISVVACTPFDVVKNYWQASPDYNHKRNTILTSGLVRNIFKKHGLKGFWSGTTISLLYVLPNSAIYFTVYEYLRQKYSSSTPVAAAEARFVSVVILSPIDLLRTRVQSKLGSTAFSELEFFVKSEPIKHFWKGVPSSLLRDVPFSMIYFTLYENSKRYLGRFGESYTFPVALINGSACAAIACVATHPFDLVKTQIQAYRGPLKFATTSAIYALKSEYGLSGLFKIGLIPRLFKVMPASGIMIATYDYTRSFLVS